MLRVSQFALFVGLASFSVSSVRLDDASDTLEDLEGQMEEEHLTYQITAEDFEQEASHGARAIEEQTCQRVRASLVSRLQTFIDVLRNQCEGYDNCSGSFSENRTEDISPISIGIADDIMVADNKGCIREVMEHPDVSKEVEEVNKYRAETTTWSVPSIPALQGRISTGFANLASWQLALVNMDRVMDEKFAIKEEEFQARACDPTCRSCKREKGSPFFKCVLKDYHVMPSAAEDGITCPDRPVRRMSKFWQWKATCVLDGTLQSRFHDVRVDAMLTCGSRSLLSTLKHPNGMSDDHMKSCMLVEQGMVLSEEKLRSWKQFSELKADGNVSDGMLKTFASFVAVSTGVGLAGLREESEDQMPLGGTDWQALLEDDTFTAVPYGLYDSLKCQEFFPTYHKSYGWFANIVGVGVGVLSLPLIPFVSMAGLVLTLHSLIWKVMGWRQYKGNKVFVKSLLAFLVPQFMTPYWGFTLGRHFFRSQKGENYWVDRQYKETNKLGCPGGLLNLGAGAMKSTCFGGLGVGQSEHLTCWRGGPDAVVKTLNVTCQGEFDGVLTWSGKSC